MPIGWVRGHLSLGMIPNPAAPGWVCVINLKSKFRIFAPSDVDIVPWAQAPGFLTPRSVSSASLRNRNASDVRRPRNPRRSLPFQRSVGRGASSGPVSRNRANRSPMELLGIRPVLRTSATDRGGQGRLGLVMVSGGGSGRWR